MIHRGSLANFVRVVFLTATFCSTMAFGAEARLRVDYKVKLTSIPEHLFHVTADIRNIREPFIDVSFPRWMPGFYKFENYAKNVQRLKVTDGKSNAAGHRMTDGQNWRIETTGTDRVIFEFDYLAETLAVNQAKITSEFGFFTGVQMLVKVEGCSDRETTVKIEAPEGWRVVSALKEGGEANTFVAANYDELVDAPTQMGKFDLDRFEVGGKAHYLVSTPAGAYEKAKREQLAGILGKIAAAQGAIFGDLPYDKYVYFYFFMKAEGRPGNAIEHNNAFVCFPPAAEMTTPEAESWRASHEFFHLWNVKRIRPTEMWPYDYNRQISSPLLWFSEGITDYYASVAVYRAGLADRKKFLNDLAVAIGALEFNEARRYVSPADSSTSTWLHADSLFPLGISYYTQGSCLGLLLDLSIRHDSRSASSLDDVMRMLYNEFYKKNRGFSTADLVTVINRLAGRDYRDFFSKYVWGVEDDPFDRILAYAGYRLERGINKRPLLKFNGGVMADQKMRILLVKPNSAAEQAGLMVGDSIDFIEGTKMPEGYAGLIPRLQGMIGQTVKVEITRGGEKKTLNLRVESRDEADYKIVELPNATPEQLKLREAWFSTANSDRHLTASR